MRRSLLCAVFGGKPVGTAMLIMLHACSERRAQAAIDTSLGSARPLPIQADFPYRPQRETFSVVQDSASWSAWRTSAGVRDLGAVVDWHSDAVVAVVAPEFVSGPARLEFTSVRLNDDTLVIRYRLVFPDIRNDYGSQEIGALALPQHKIAGHVIRVQREVSEGGEPGLARPLPNER